MTLNIQIFLDGILQEERQLSSGEYTLGRAPESDIILKHEGASRNHAALSVSSQKIIIKDNNSTSGTYYQGKKFSQKTFKTNFSIEIGPFDIFFDFGSGINENIKRKKTKRQIDFSSLRIETVLFASLIILVLVTSSLLYFAFKSQLRDFQKKELTSRGHIITRCLLELNEDYVISEQYNSLKTKQIKNEIGVIYAVILDRNGKIIASSEEEKKIILESVIISKIIINGKMGEYDGRRGEKIISYPVLKINDVVGFAVIGYDMDQGMDSYGINNYYIMMIIVFISVSCIFLRSLLIKIFFKPLQELSETVDEALKDSKNRIEFHCSSPEIKELVIRFNRLLIRSDIPESEYPENDNKEVYNNVQEEESLKYSENDFLSFENIRMPCCLVDRMQYSIVKYNQFFDTFISDTELLRRESGLTEIFTKSGLVTLLNAVSEIIEGIKTEEKVETERGNFLVKSVKTDEDNKVIIVFEEIKNG